MESYEESDNQVVETFDDMGLHDNILRGIYAYGFEVPSQIQKKAIIPVIKGRDILAQAQSGTGKTATFLIGTLQRIFDSMPSDEISTIIVAPTRELAQQIFTVCNELTTYTDINSMCAIGGYSISNNLEKLYKENVHLVIGTPGRILHLCKKGMNMKNIKTIILDEVDEMFSIGFKDQIYDIFQYLPNDCQVGLFSATLQCNTLELSKKILRDPVKVFVKDCEVTLDGISQFYIDVKQEQWKFDTLLDIYDKLSISQTMIYTNSKKKADKLRYNLEKEGHIVECIHSDMSQKERNSILNDYRCGKSRILITTDILSRGIDIQQVSIVINYDLPAHKEVYIHRIGRSGRFGRKGIAINLISSREYKQLNNIENFYETEIREMPNDISSFI